MQACATICTVGTQYRDTLGGRSRSSGEKMGRGGTNPGSLLQGHVTLRPGDSRDLHCVAPSVHSTEAGALGKRWFSPFLSEGPIFGDAQFPHFRAQ